MNNTAISTIFEWYPWIPPLMSILSIFVITGMIYLYRKKMESTINKYLFLTLILSFIASIWITEVILQITGWSTIVTVSQNFVSTSIVIVILMMDHETVQKFKKLIQRPSQSANFNTTPLEDEFVFDDDFPDFEEIIA